MKAIGPQMQTRRPGLLRGRQFNARHRSFMAVRATLAGAEPTARQQTAGATDSMNEALLKPSQAQLIQGLKGPVVKITAHYHVNFGDCLKVVGSSEDFGAWDAAAAPLMTWGEGDVWSLVTPLGPGDHEFKVVVQKGDGDLIWEGGDNRKVSVPEDAPEGSMLLAECAFNYADLMPEPELLPVTEDVLQVLEQQAVEAVAAQAAAAAVEVEKQKVSEAASAVAKALATMDAEAAETGRRSALSSLSSDDVMAAGGNSSSPDSSEDEVMSAAVGQPVGVSRALAAAEEAVTAEDEQAEAAAEEELAEQLEAMSVKVHPAPAASSLAAKISQDRPVAIGFIDLPAPTTASSDATADAEAPAAKAAAPAAGNGGTTSNVVASFMKSVAGKAAPVAAAAAAAPPATPVTETAPTAEPAEPEAGVPEATAPAAELEEAASTAAAAAPATTTAAAAAEPEASEPVAATAAATEAPQQALTVKTKPAADSASSSASAAKDAIAAIVAAAAAAAPPTPPSSPSSVGAVVTRGAALTAAALSSRGRAITVPGSPRDRRPPSPGRGSSHVAAAAAAAAALDWVDGVRSNGVVAAAREAERAAAEKAAKLFAAQKAASAAAAESARLSQGLNSGSSVLPGSCSGLLAEGAAVAARRLAVYGGTLSTAAAAGAAMPAPPGVISTRDQAYGVSSSLLSAAASASAAAAAAAAADLSPPAISSPAMATSAGSSALAADSAAAGSADASYGSGMQLLSAMVGCAAVGTVLWSEFVLKESGCGLPPGPYGLLGAAEGLSYLTVLGFAGAGVAARGSSGGKQGLRGPLVVPEVLAYGALGAGLLVLASQMKEYGYIPPPLPGGQCYADAALAGDELSAQLTAQLVALQAVMSQLKSAAADGIDQLQLQEQIAVLQQQVDAFSAYTATQAAVLDQSLHAGILQLQDSLTAATAAVNSFVDTQLQQLDIPGKLTSVLELLRKQERQLVEELPKQFAELQRLAATATSMVQETALQAATESHLPELLASLDKSMAVLHDVLENKIDQLDVMLTQLHDSCASAAAQLAVAASAAQQAGSAEAAAQLAQLQELLSGAIASVQEQTWVGYQQLALADHLSDMLLRVRASATEVAASTAAEVDKLHLQQQLEELEAIAGASVSALAATALDQLKQLELEQKLAEIEAQAGAAAASLQQGLVQQYHAQLPILQDQLAHLQDNVAELAASAQAGLKQQQAQLSERGPELEALLLELQKSMEATVKVVAEVASSSVDTAGQKLQATTNASLSQLSGGVAELVSAKTAAVGPAGSGEGLSVAAATLAPAVTDAVTDAAVSAGSYAAAAAVDAAPSVAAGNDAVVSSAVGMLEASTGGAQADAYTMGGVDMSDASDAVKAIWANRPQ